MPRKTIKMFTAERTGLVAIVALILFIAAMAMCRRASGPSENTPTAPDSSILQKIDSTANTPTEAPPSKSIKRKTRKKTNPQPFRRNHRDETIKTLS